MLVIGLDPGTDTGLAEWEVKACRFRTVGSMQAHRAHALVLNRFREHVDSEQGIHGNPLLVMFEDARRRGAAPGQSASRAQGAGSVKRDCTIWQELCDDYGIPYVMGAPIAGGTKWTAEYFRRQTGWDGVTNEHARDAAVRVWQLTEPQVDAMLREWQQRRTLAALPKSRKARMPKGVKPTTRQDTAEALKRFEDRWRKP